MNKKLMNALEVGLQRMQQGESLDSVLQSSPELAAQLRPLLETAQRARLASRLEFPPLTLARQRARGLALAQDLNLGNNRHPLQRRAWRLALTILCVLAILTMSSNGLLNASAHSIPGDSLYPFKRSLESTQLQLVFDPAQKQALEQAFSQRRIEETKSLITIQRVESVEFIGVVSSRSRQEWVVSGITVVVTPRTDIDDAIQVGSQIDVDGSTNTAGDVVAIRLSLTTHPDNDNPHPGSLQAQTPTPDLSANSSTSATLTGPSVKSAPAHSSDGHDQEKDGEGQSSGKSAENHSSGDNKDSHSYSGDGGN